MQGVRYNSTGGSAAILESGHNRLLCGPGPLDIPLDKWVKGDITMNAPLVRAITKCPLCGGYKCRGRLLCGNCRGIYTEHGAHKFILDRERVLIYIDELSSGLISQITYGPMGIDV